MMLYNTTGIILGKKDIGEADALYKIFNKDRGLITLKAKSTRKIKSRLKSHLLKFSEVSLFVAKGKTFDIIAGAETIKQFSLKLKSLETIHAAEKMSFLMMRLAQGDNNQKLYDSFLEALMLLTVNPAKAGLVTTAFGFRAMALSGFCPELYRCIVCNDEIKEELNYFDHWNGGLKCSRENSKGRKITPQEIKIIRFMTSSGVSKSVQIKSTGYEANLSSALKLFLLAQVGEMPRAFEYMEGLA